MMHDQSNLASNRRLRLTAALLGLLPWPLAWADLTVTYRQSGQNCAAPFQSVYLKGSLLRFDSEDGVTIYDGVEQTMTFVAHGSQQSFTMELDEDALDLQSDVGQALGHRLDKEMAHFDATMAQMQPKQAKHCQQMEAQGIACPQTAPMAAGMPGSLDANTMLAQQQAMMERMDPKQLKKLGIDVEELSRHQREAMAEVQAEQAIREAERIEVGQDRVGGVSCTQVELRSGEHVIERRCEATVAALALPPREQAALSIAIRRMQRLSATMEPIMQRVMGEKSAEPESPTLLLQRDCFDAGQKAGSATASIARSVVSASMFDSASVGPGEFTSDRDP